MPSVVVGLLWLWILDPLVGVLNGLLSLVGLARLPFLTSVEFALPSVAGMNVWRHLGYTALLFYAGMETISSEIYEASLIDGAGPIQEFRYITLPLLRPVFAFVLVTSIIGSFQVFDTIAVTTGGGPVSATRVINWLIYETAFRRFQMGYATAISFVVFALLVAISILQMRLFRADEVDV
jgi:multiple sugar transport system permease protein